MVKSEARRTYEMRARALAAADTRSRILAAAQERFLADHYDAVTLDQVAGAAGVTRQTVLNHFRSKENLFLRAAELVSDGRERAKPTDPDDALRILIDGYEFIGDTIVGLLAMTRRIPELDTFLEDGRREHQEWLAAIWSHRLPAAGPERHSRIVALHAATDLYVWRLLRRDLGLDPDQVRAVMARLVEGALDAD